MKRHVYKSVDGNGLFKNGEPESSGSVHKGTEDQVVEYSNKSDLKLTKCQNDEITDRDCLGSSQRKSLSRPQCYKHVLNCVCRQIGDTSIDPTAKFDSPAEVEAFLKPFYDRGYRQIDTARGYSPHAPLSCEPRLGAANVGDKFIISTKVVSRPDGAHTRDKIAQSIDDSLEALKVSQVDIMYLHQPNRTVPFEETAKAMDKAYREGKFKRFGLSNYTAAEVEQFLKISEERGFVKPTVYQGQYNPVVRTGEKELFPLLHKHNIAFYAWRYALLQFN